MLVDLGFAKTLGARRYSFNHRTVAWLQKATVTPVLARSITETPKGDFPRIPPQSRRVRRKSAVSLGLSLELRNMMMTHLFFAGRHDCTAVRYDPRQLSEADMRAGHCSYETSTSGNLRITFGVFPYGDVVVRHMLYGRIRGKGNGPPTLTSTEADEMILYRGKFMTRQAVLEEVLAVVELPADDMTRDPNVDYADAGGPEVRLMDSVNHTSPNERSVKAGSGQRLVV